MKNTTLSKLVTNAAFAVTASLLVTRSASAVPVSAMYVEDARCDVLPFDHPTHELGDVNFFPANEAIQVTVTPTNIVKCVPDDLINNDYLVNIRNLSGVAWRDLYFVCDSWLTVGNSDGSMIDQIGAPTQLSDAFKIDGTVTVTGGNDNLVFESMNTNEIFEPLESWSFYVTNFMAPSGLTPPPTFQTPGVFAGSSPFNAAFPNSASILASPVVPEPTSLCLLAVFSGMLMMRRR